MKVLVYTLDYDHDRGISRVIIPELNDLTLKRRPSDIFTDDSVLDIMHFCYNAWFVPYDSKTFTEIEIQKQGGNDQLARATSYYEQLTREEADCIITDIVRTSLGIDEFELKTLSDALIEENEAFDDEVEELTDEEIEAEIGDLLLRADEDFAEIDEFIELHEDEYSEDLLEFAFREAVRKGVSAYVEEHADDFDLNDAGDSSTYLNETDDEEIIEILMNHGAFRSLDDYSDKRFAMETVNGTIVVLEPEFQKEVFAKYKKEFELTDAKIVDVLENGIYDDASGRDVDDDLSILGVEVSDGCITFVNRWGEDGWSLKELLEDLGWECEFEGDSWKLETVGVYFID